MIEPKTRMSEAKARANDPETGCEVAELINVSRDKRAVLVLSALWESLNFGTDEDICEEAHLKGDYEFCTPQSLKISRAELMRCGYIKIFMYDDNTPIYRKTTYNLWCHTYKLTDKGRKLAEALFG